MVKTIQATFDGKVLRPDEPLPLEPNARVRITVESVERSKGKAASFLRTARSLKIEGPPDWAV
ncbi:MAG: DUF104 domain-containing protein, partial [Planctomycetes bacterium]|nr:DUF104 domain-containing protein [Planctomycetota bacterium]